ncbi:hypothetical protein GWI33_004615 [Rhynchophorus ferrugineus]|uniref:Uncharacterized protein n=1 Tax=Rhynchophorus ferrugineus TaxID=354439 RepID=A0A834MMW9_RHYFE|nr:hypothetical protein GWI33_004615 [Rhynchophorus ferrugineus]
MPDGTLDFFNNNTSAETIFPFVYEVRLNLLIRKKSHNSYVGLLSGQSGNEKSDAKANFTSDYAITDPNAINPAFLPEAG